MWIAQVVMCMCAKGISHFLLLWFPRNGLDYFAVFVYMKRISSEIMYLKCAVTLRK